MSEQVVIVGGGIAGLTAAIELERAGKKPILIERSDRVGGRIRTDRVNGFRLDHGFQVLLTAYPEAQHYLDYKKLDLKTFDPGAVIYKGENRMVVSDPLRDPSRALGMLFSSVGGIKDKLLTYKLTTKLKKKPIGEIFNAPSTSTMQYLKSFGYSQKMIDNFFVPFFGGIYLENELRTSSRMFEFVFKMFSTGHAAIPAKGMEEIPRQLADQLNSTELRLNTDVTDLSAKELTIADGETIGFDRLIIASPPNKLLSGFKEDFHEFEAVTNIYFKTTERIFSERMIALVPDPSVLINNFTVISDISPEYSSGGESLISVSINGSPEKEVLGIVRNELAEIAGFNAEMLEHVKTYELKKALPRIEDQSYSMEESAVKVQDNIFLAGDFLLNASLNAAMVSGRTAAKAVLGY